MVLHRRTHPVFVEGCGPCRWASVAISADATPTRTPRAAEINATEKRWGPDMDAYKRLVESGTQPNNIDGCAELEQTAENKYDWAMMKRTGWKDRDIARAEQVMDDVGMEHI
jgi:hypothetical protein